MQPAFIRFAFACLMLLLSGAANLSAQAAAQPGQRIINQATAFAFIPDSAKQLDLLSNQVITNILGTPGLLLVQDRSVFLSPGASTSFNHVLTNTGNETSSYQLDYQNELGDDYDFGFLRLIEDTNGNGVIDTGEPIINSGDTVTLTAGAFRNYILSGVISPSAQTGQQGVATFTAELLATGETQLVTDTATVGFASPQLLKSVDRTTAEQGDPVTYTLTMLSGAEPLEPILVNIDGAVVSRVILRDSMPRNTIFSSFLSNPAGLTELYHLRSFANDQEYTTTPPSDLNDVEAIAYARASVPAAQVFVVSFEVTVKDNASGTFTNEGFLYYRLNGGNTNEELPSNEVSVDVPIDCDDITLTSFNGSGDTTQIIEPGASLFFEVEASLYNLSQTELDTLEMVLSSEGTGDEELLPLIETGPNTGIFRLSSVAFPNGVPTVDGSANNNDSIMQTNSSDVLKGSLFNVICDNNVKQIEIYVNPGGIVFDSRTGARLAGAVVELRDGFGTLIESVTTGADGLFEFLDVPAGDYYLKVTPPLGYTEFSIVPEPLLASIDGARPRIDATGSYGDPFTIEEGRNAVFFDFPLDTETPEGFALEKEVNRSEVEIGDSVQYKITLDNTIGAQLPGAYIRDVLPAGVTYIGGSTRIDGVKASDPEGAPGPTLQFELGNVEDEQIVVLTYRARIAFGADRGDGINRAQAFSRGAAPSSSNVATAQINIDQGVFSDEGVIFGKVFVDLNDNKIHDTFGPNGEDDDGEGDDMLEPVVPGVRIFLEDGTYAITDVEGKYSIYGQRAITHVVKLDTYTLPAGTELAIIDGRNANDPGSRFADMRKGELHKANFRIVNPTPELLAEVAGRVEQGAVFTPEIDRALKRNFDYEDNDQNSSLDQINDDASGTIEGASFNSSFYEPILPPDTLTAGNSRLPQRAVAAVPHLPLEEELGSVPDAKIGFMDLKDGDTLALAQARVRIKGQLGTVLKLEVNGSEVPETRIGKRVEATDRGIHAVEYVGVPLNAGRNTLTATQFDSFGNARGSETIQLIAPANLAKISLELSNSEPVADGITPVEVTVRVADENGTPVSARLPLTLETTAGRWDVEDVNKTEPGTQVFLTNGEAVYRLLPPAEPSDANIEVSSGIIRSTERFAFLPDLRPMVAAGIVQGRIHLRNLGKDSIVPAHEGSGFEEELRTLSDSGDDRLEGRAAFFLKGKIKGDILLTAAYDSDKDEDAELFRDIDPDKYYPIYGDSSVRGYDAQSSGKLYVRLDKKRSYLLWGDFETRSDHEAVDFGDYSRSLNGFNGQYENDRVKVSGFASQTSAVQVIDEISANGTSGPFRLSGSNGLLNSEKVEVLVRDRNQPAVILETRTLTRYVDYEFEAFSGSLVLRRPLASFDTELNPQSIRVTYEVDEGGEEHLVYGANAQVKVNEHLEVGAGYVRDENPEVDYELKSANATVKLPFNSYLITEVAESDDLVEGNGTAYRAEIRRAGERTEARIFYGEADESFVNPTASLTSGRIEAGAEVTHLIDASTRLEVEAIYEEDVVTEGSRKGVKGMVYRRFPNQVELGLGGRVSHETGTPASGTTTIPSTSEDITPNSIASVIVAATAPVPHVPDMRMRGEVEQDVRDTDKTRVLLGADYQISTKTRAYVTHEFINSLGNEFTLNETQTNNRTLFGLETDYMEGGQYFNEYRVRDAVEGEQAEGAIGLRNQWSVAEGLRLNTTFEKVRPFTGETTNESTAATASIEYTAPEDWKATSRLEYRTSDTNDSVLATLGYARKINRNWSILTKTYVYEQTNKDADTDDLTQVRVRSGFAWRQTNQDVWNMLLLHEYKYEDGMDVLDTISQERHVNVLSHVLNYQPDENWIWTNRVAAKWVNESSADDDFTDNYAAYLFNGRIRRDISDRFDIGLNYSLMWDDGDSGFNYGLGPEIGMWVVDNFRLGLGYNFWGFTDRDFETSGRTQSGFFITFNFKFDENTLGFGRQ
ncbi:carboxypeptidase regulatory-like domain-containing protein [Coraliomargarita sp. W4R53]